jgi:hypothetical protein
MVLLDVQMTVVLITSTIVLHISWQQPQVVAWSQRSYSSFQRSDLTRFSWLSSSSPEAARTPRSVLKLGPQCKSCEWDHKCILLSHHSHGYYRNAGIRRRVTSLDPYSISRSSWYNNKRNHNGIHTNNSDSKNRMKLSSFPSILEDVVVTNLPTTQVITMESSATTAFSTSFLLHRPELWSGLIMLSIVGLLWLWDTIIENLKEETPPYIHQVIDAILAEMGGIGFIGLFISTILHNPIFHLSELLDHLSEEYLGNEEILFESYVQHDYYFVCLFFSILDRFFLWYLFQNLK